MVITFITALAFANAVVWGVVLYFSIRNREVIDRWERRRLKSSSD